MIDRDRVRVAHGDAWEAEGRARAAVGGGATRVRGARLMASGLPFAQWNNADVTGADVDQEAVRHWYAERGVPWGIRVPVEMPVALGKPLFVKRCFGLESSGFDSAEPRAAIDVRRLGDGEMEDFVAAEAAVFGGDLGVARRWVGPVFGRPGFEHWIGRRDATPAAIASVVWSWGLGGTAAMVTGLGAVDPSDAEALRNLLSGVLTAIFQTDPAALAHSYAAEDEDARGLRAARFVEIPGFLVRVVVSEEGQPPAGPTA